MLFRSDEDGDIAVSQPMHAWISGQLMRALSGTWSEPLLLAAEQHDIAWLDWETNPTFDVESGRPHLFRNVGAFLHAPMWRKGVDRALAAWGPQVALLVSRHGGVIYRRFATRHQGDERDRAAAQDYLREQAPQEAAWADELGLSPTELEAQSAVIAFVDTLSLALCGELKTPLELTLPGEGGNAATTLRLETRSAKDFTFSLSPWPFARARVTVEGEGWRLPAAGRFADEAAFRAWREKAPRAPFSARLTSE